MTGSPYADAPVPAPVEWLWEALGLGGVERPVVAIVGGGGKTALLYRLGWEAEQRGLTVVMAGTTRFTPPPPKTALGASMVAGDHETLLGAARGAAPAGGGLIVHSGPESQGRLGAIEPGTADAIAALPNVGLVALEADGSKMRPFKAPGEHEPVIPRSVTHVVAVVGMRALDAPLDEGAVHRPEAVRAIVGEEPRCSAAVIARVMADPRGGRKDVGGRPYAVVVNQADLDPDGARELAEAIRAAGVARVVVTSLRDAERPVLAVLAG
jgi:molybdenum cofactor cytidylyltransferase